MVASKAEFIYKLFKKYLNDELSALTGTVCIIMKSKNVKKD